MLAEDFQKNTEKGGAAEDVRVHGDVPWGVDLPAEGQRAGRLPIGFIIAERLDAYGEHPRKVHRRAQQRQQQRSPFCVGRSKRSELAARAQAVQDKCPYGSCQQRYQI